MGCISRTILLSYKSTQSLRQLESKAGLQTLQHFQAVLLPSTFRCLKHVQHLQHQMHSAADSSLLTQPPCQRMTDPQCPVFAFFTTQGGPHQIVSMIAARQDDWQTGESNSSQCWDFITDSYACAKD